MKVSPPGQRVHRFLKRLRAAPAFQWEDVPDPRKRRGRRWKLAELLEGLFSGMLAGATTLRAVEDLTEDMGTAGRMSRRMPDTTAYDLLTRLRPEDLRAKLRSQVRALHRAKCLPPEGLPCGVLSIDGKALGSLDHSAEGKAQQAHRSHDGSTYYLARVLRAVLTSAAARPCLDQVWVPSTTNEMGTFPALWDTLIDAYGALDLFEIVTADAGFTSRENADRIAADHRAYVFALKETQPELLAEAERQLQLRRKDPPDAETPWERVDGIEIRRRLYRIREIAGYHGWSHLQQVWEVQQDRRTNGGRVETTRRLFLTNLHWGRLTADQILRVIRGHWGIENDCFGTLDLQWDEDARPWCTHGEALAVIGCLRVMAYNLLQVARKRHLRRRARDGRLAPAAAWRRIFEWVRQALILPTLLAPSPAVS